MRGFSFILCLYISTMLYPNVGLGETGDFLQPDSMVLIHGKVFDAVTKKPVTAKITYEKQPFADDMGVVSSKSERGFKMYMLNTQSYAVEVRATGYLSYRKVINFDELSASIEEEMNFTIVPMSTTQSIRLRNVSFLQGESTITPDSFDELNSIVKYMKENPKVVLQVEGHTDFRGNKRLNLALSSQRAETVSEYLIAHGIKKKRIKTKAYGGSRPITDENTEEAKRQNRRVEVRILKY